MTIFTLGEIISAPVSNAYVARLAPEPLRGRYLGTLALAWNSAAIVGPYLGSQLMKISPSCLWTACAALGLLSALVILRASPAPEIPIANEAAPLPMP